MYCIIGIPKIFIIVQIALIAGNPEFGRSYRFLELLQLGLLLQFEIVSILGGFLVTLLRCVRFPFLPFPLYILANCFRKGCF